jgi:hypothetical protein
VAGSSPTHQSRAALTLLAFGVVFGDIGTSPLYAVKETFAPAHGIALTAENILGGLSTIFWALITRRIHRPKGVSNCETISISDSAIVPQATSTGTAPASYE